MAQPLETREGLDFQANSPSEAFYHLHQPDFAEIKSRANYLEQLVLLTENLGDEYARARISELTLPPDDREEITRRVLGRDFGQVSVNQRNYDTALQLRRETEQFKRRMIFQEIIGNKETPLISPVERILLLGGIILAEYTDAIYFDQWLPEVRDSKIGKYLAAVERRKKGSASDVLPGKAEETHWFTRRLKLPFLPILKQNIQLVPYSESLADVPKIIKVLDGMVEMLQEEKDKSGNDYGYIRFLQAWPSLLKGKGNQKQLEDQMMIAWRQIDPETPVFIVPWAEHEYGDPAGRAMAPSLRIGVKSTSPETARLIADGKEAKSAILEYIEAQGIPGREAVDRSNTYHMVWTGYAGLDVIIAMTSQTLPNDQNIRAIYGCTVLPNFEQQIKGEQMRIEAAVKGYPAHIEARLKELKFTLEEIASIETEAHEYFHHAGVIQKGRDRLAKLVVLFEEPKATCGGMLTQVRHRNNAEFSQRAVASLLYVIPRYLTRDGSITHQGYANIARITADVAEKAGILTYDRSGKILILDIDDGEKIVQFWDLMEEYIMGCCRAYVDATQVQEAGVKNIQAKVGQWLEGWSGIKSKAEDGKVTDIPLIDMIKAYYRNS